MPLRPGYDFVHYHIYRRGVEVKPEDLPQEEQDLLWDSTNAYAALLEKCECFDHPGSTNMLRITWKDGLHAMAWCCCELRLMQLEFLMSRHPIPLELTYPSVSEPLTREQLQDRFLQWWASYFEVEVPRSRDLPPSQE